MKRSRKQKSDAPVELTEAETATVTGGTSHFDGRLLTADDLKREQSLSGDPDSPIIVGSVPNDESKTRS